MFGPLQYCTLGSIDIYIIWHLERVSNVWILIKEFIIVGHNTIEEYDLGKYM